MNTACKESTAGSFLCCHHFHPAFLSLLSYPLCSQQALSIWGIENDISSFSLASMTVGKMLFNAVVHSSCWYDVVSSFFKHIPAKNLNIFHPFFLTPKGLTSTLLKKKIINCNRKLRAAWCCIAIQIQSWAFITVFEQK